MARQRNIIITGGTSGIGLALIQRICMRHRIITTGRTMTPELEKIIDAFPLVEFVKADFSEPEKASKVLEKALRKAGWEHVDFAVLNAGTGHAQAPQSEEAISIRETMDVNLNANIALAQLLFKRLHKARGKITFIGSTARKGNAGLASYAASKAALQGLARALREEWRGKVFVQILQIGPTKTAMHEKAGLKLGPIRHFFTDVKSMAAMIEKSITRRRFSMTLTAFQDWTGATVFSRGIR